MNKRIQYGVFAFDEVEFIVKPCRGTIILRITRFASIMIVRFDLATAKINDIAIGVIHVGFFMKATLWLKIYSNLNG
jgi:hypothetical protein